MKKELLEIKTATLTEKGQICIPSSFRPQGFKNGSKVSILVFHDHIELRPMKQISESLETALASEKVLAKDWNTKKEDEAWKDL
ncbi:AbrB/MazE/SpoVT family DNA-binding domain-containing protein [Candidatus Woesearchaeota archaeon]|nr:MAG: AbrB/MazE/SpoVT family DNA-binding domain-containing protein [Candidatus Woesearchaeota archaeon]